MSTGSESAAIDCAGKRQRAPSEQFSPPSSRLRYGEVRALRQVPRLVAASRRLGLRSEVGGAGDAATIDVTAPTVWPQHNDSPEVLVVPGLGTNDISTVPLRRYLRHRGYRCRGWGLGTNHGQLDKSLPEVADLVAELSGGGERPITLIGQSLGGVFVREAARHQPHQVTQVITLGTPLWGPRYTGAAHHFRGEIVAIEDLIEKSNRTPIQVPLTAFYSTRDGVVDWRTCIDTMTPEVENIEVLSTHFGMGLDPDVWTAVLERL